MISSQSLSNLPDYSLTQPVNGFDYEKLDTNIRMLVQQRTSEIQNLMRRTNQEIIEIGQKLTDVKAQLGHGNFGMWLKAEFDWSARTANRFMQVAESFKLVTVTNLDITASALYFLASPSTPQEARAEAFLRATNGEKINYALAKTVVSEHKKATKPKLEKFVSFDIDTQSVFSYSAKSIEQEENETNGVRDMLRDQVRKEVKTEVPLLSTQDLMPDSRVKEHLIVETLETNEEQIEDIAPTAANIVNSTVLAEEIPQTIVTEIKMIIQELPEEELAQLTLAIITSAKNRLSKNRFSAIITLAQQAIN